MTDQPDLDPDADGERRRALLAAARSADKVRAAILDRAVTMAFAVQQGATVAELAGVVGLDEEQIQRIVDRASEVEVETREARCRQAQRLVDHARQRRDDADGALRAAEAFAAQFAIGDDGLWEEPTADR